MHTSLMTVNIVQYVCGLTLIMFVCVDCGLTLIMFVSVDWISTNYTSNVNPYGNLT